MEVVNWIRKRRVDFVITIRASSLPNDAKVITFWISLLPYYPVPVRLVYQTSRPKTLHNSCDWDTNFHRVENILHSLVPPTRHYALTLGSHFRRKNTFTKKLSVSEISRKAKQKELHSILGGRGNCRIIARCRPRQTGRTERYDCRHCCVTRIIWCLDFLALGKESRCTNRKLLVRSHSRDKSGVVN